MMDGRGWWEFWMNDGKIRLFDQSFAEREPIPISDRQSPGSRARFKSYDLDTHWGITWSDGVLVGAIVVERLGGKSTRIMIPLSKDENPILMWNRLCLFRNQVDDKYRGYLIGQDGSYRVLEDAEVVPWLLGQSKAFSYRSGVLYYGSANLLSVTSGFDDEMNLYWGRTVFFPDGTQLEIQRESTDRSYFFDYEGNFWETGWTDDKAKNPILYYAGRDWGYREPPKKAVTTEAGLRIRLRASTEAFVLGSLGKGEAITILKTGETATLGGVTAPWYRIKKADGLIGWAFGGFIKVLE